MIVAGGKRQLSLTTRQAFPVRNRSQEPLIFDQCHAMDGRTGAGLLYDSLARSHGLARSIRRIWTMKTEKTDTARKTLRACLKTLENRRVRARGLQAWAEKPVACRPGALTGRVFKHALLTSMEVRELLGISSCELMHLREAGELSAIRKGNAYLYAAADVDRLQQSQAPTRRVPAH